MHWFYGEPGTIPNRANVKKTVLSRAFVVTSMFPVFHNSSSLVFYFGIRATYLMLFIIMYDHIALTLALKNTSAGRTAPHTVPPHLWEISHPNIHVYVFMKCEASVAVNSSVIFYHFTHAYTPFSTIKLHSGVSGRRSQIPLIANLFSVGHINTRWIVNNCGTPSRRAILELPTKIR